jgi:hypothetical protein
MPEAGLNEAARTADAMPARNKAGEVLMRVL